MPCNLSRVNKNTGSRRAQKKHKGHDVVTQWVVYFLDLCGLRDVYLTKALINTGHDEHEETKGPRRSYQCVVYFLDLCGLRDPVFNKGLNKDLQDVLNKVCKSTKKTSRNGT